MAEYVLWQLKNDHLGAGVEMVQMATLPNMEPANVEQWMRMAPVSIQTGGLPWI